MSQEHKTCTKCNETKHISEFIWDKSKDNYHSWCRKCKAKSSKEYRNNNKKTKKDLKKDAERFRKWRKTRRQEVIKRLGRKCIKCNYDKDIRALHIDHINGDGSFDRKRFGSSNDTYITYLLSLNNEELKENYQCLCANCNWIKRYEERSYN